jgi:hypothetical protein
MPPKLLIAIVVPILFNAALALKALADGNRQIRRLSRMQQFPVKGAA